MFRYMRMSPDTFDHLLRLVGPKISKQNTQMREAISADERLSLTLHYLAEGASQQSMAFQYRIAKSTVSKIIHETCGAIWEALHEIYLRPPKSKDEWLKISQQFEELWNFPHCLGAIDGKHITMQCPLKSGSLYYNYKGYFSIVLLALCDAHYTFTFIDIGAYGSCNDSSIFNSTSFCKAVEAGALDLPGAEPLEGFPNVPLPYFFVGDEAFALKTWMQRPYPGRKLPEDKRIFNYRLSRARRVIENSFGILAARWRIFHRPIQTAVETAENIVKAAVCLHNYLKQTSSAAYCPTGFIDSEDSTGQIQPGEWRRIVAEDNTCGGLRALRPSRGARYPLDAAKTREALKEYVNSKWGSVSWQCHYVRSRGEVLADFPGQ